MYVSAKVPASCGELVQGSLDGEPFLVTCPVDIYATAEVGDTISGREGLGWKAAKALELWLRKRGINELPFGLRLQSPIPRGKGMASSSADISAVLSAVAVAVGEEASLDEIAEIAAAIEPTDGVFFPGLVRMNYLTGRRQESLGNPPPLNIIIFDCGGTVDTLSFARPALDEEHMRGAAAALRAVTGLTAADIATGATLSARLNQKILPKPCLEEVAQFSQANGALGLNVAHSGTVIGIFFAADESEERLFAHAANIGWRFPELRFTAHTRLVGGGVQYEVRR